MRILIDGYNLLHAVWPAEGRQLRPRAWPRFRQRLLDRLRNRHADRDGAVTVVFDAAGSRPGGRDQEAVGGIQVRFAAGYPSADDLIEELIRVDSAPASLTVVTDDRRLRDAARRRGCTPRGCLDYIESLEVPEAPPGPIEPLPAKPEDVAPDEVEHWLKEFGEGAGG
jgi:predicted RNA-binding protein with PIN domain